MQTNNVSQVDSHYVVTNSCYQHTSKYITLLKPCCCHTLLLCIKNQYYVVFWEHQPNNKCEWTRITLHSTYTKNKGDVFVLLLLLPPVKMTTLMVISHSLILCVARGMLQFLLPIIPRTFNVLTDMYMFCRLKAACAPCFTVQCLHLLPTYNASNFYAFKCPPTIRNQSKTHITKICKFERQQTIGMNHQRKGNHIKVFITA